ncbi:hypothetical protein [Lentibacillus sediminis]|uniref:hypothetical protein n=1 Tax=Lentibacillus sediminis TaxID=1940529 RepID=UPI000C1BC76A|nr:hypothetical protein [Lentibacillus sediminis]
MKKPSSFMNKGNGFILPYVLFIIALVLILIMGNITQYRSEFTSTALQIENVRVETLFQMGREKWKQEIAPHGAVLDQVTTYDFPVGTVEINLVAENEERYKLHFIMKTGPEYQHDLTHYLEKVPPANE